MDNGGDLLEAFIEPARVENEVGRKNIVYLIVAVRRGKEICFSSQ